MGRKGEKVWRGFILGKFLIKLGDFLFKSCGHTAATSSITDRYMEGSISGLQNATRLTFRSVSPSLISLAFRPEIKESMELRTWRRNSCKKHQTWLKNRRLEIALVLSKQDFKNF